MAVEHHYHTDSPVSTSSDTSAVTVLVAVVAILFIIGLAIYAMRGAGLGTTPAVPGQIDVNVEGQLPGATNGAATQTPVNP